MEGYGLAAVMGAPGIDGTRTRSNHIIEVGHSVVVDGGHGGSLFLLWEALFALWPAPPVWLNMQRDVLCSAAVFFGIGAISPKSSVDDHNGQPLRRVLNCGCMSGAQTGIGPEG